jgi:hypothetical protein
VLNRRLVEALLVCQAAAIVGLLAWLLHESQANLFFQAWLSQNIPFGNVLVSPWFIASAMGTVVSINALLMYSMQMSARFQARPIKVEPHPEDVERPPPRPFQVDLAQPPYRPFYETMEMRTLILTTLLAAQAASLWFITISIFHVTDFPADSFYYVKQLPYTYWWGLAATMALFGLRYLLAGRMRTSLELSSLFLLALYLIGLPSFAYENPRFLDTYYHEGNSLDMLNFGGWLGSPSWYGHQFPGAFSFIAQLTSVAGIDPYSVMKYYPIALSWIVVLFVYTIARMHSTGYAAPATGLLLGGLWFQLHVSPQSLELILYLGFLYLLLKVIDDKPRKSLWTGLTLAATPIFVASHPETPLAVDLGLAAFLMLSLLQSRQTIRSLLRQVQLPSSFLVVWTILWWSQIAVDARTLVTTTILSRAILSLSQLPLGITTLTSGVPSTPDYSYAVTIMLEQTSSATVWILGLSLFVLLRRFQARELLLGGLFLAAVSSIPLAIFGRADVLQRSYLFALFPLVLLFAWLLERKVVPTLQGRSLLPLFKTVFVILMIVFIVVIPVTRYGVDPFQYLTGSSLFVSSVAAGLGPHSILFLHPDEDGWRFYASLNGATSQPKIEQKDIHGLPEGFVKPTSDPTLPPFNLTFTQSDKTADYIFLSDYYQDLYHLRFGENSAYYTNARTGYEGNVIQNFNLVYSTGTDRLYANRDLP